MRRTLFTVFVVASLVTLGAFGGTAIASPDPDPYEDCLISVVDSSQCDGLEGDDSDDTELQNKVYDDGSKQVYTNDGDRTVVENDQDEDRTILGEVVETVTGSSTVADCVEGVAGQGEPNDEQDVAQEIGENELDEIDSSRVSKGLHAVTFATAAKDCYDGVNG
ncbi:hypothetical protein BRC81_04225 [Halobacteriales archaeon QS_1_68_20]|nr:MAG: hypothetical protein BRC81_04225 [Halobacteriales archaeon QS_1_68_20]